MYSEMNKVKIDNKDIRDIVEDIYDSMYAGNTYKVIVSQDTYSNKYDVLLKSDVHNVILYKDIMKLGVAEQYVKLIYDFLYK